MGLGLALARLALQRQGGSIGARNNPGEGATVYVELPVAPGQLIQDNHAEDPDC
jgi:signal transduction histidine kinase